MPTRRPLQLALCLGDTTQPSSCTDLPSAAAAPDAGSAFKRTVQVVLRERP